MTQKKTIGWKTWLLLLGCTAALFWFSYRLFALFCFRPNSDLSIHMTWAGECSFGDWRSFFHHAAHPMWHVLVTLARTLFGFSLEQTAAAVTALCKAAEFVLVACCFSGRKRCGAGGRAGRPLLRAGGQSASVLL